MKHPSASVANAFLSKAFEERVPITPMKIQKLIYLAHGYSLAAHGEPLLDEVFEAWKFGPVLSSVYHACKGYKGQRGITKYIKNEDWITGEKSPAPLLTDPRALETVDLIWEHYGDVEATTLSNWTHERGGPWDKVTKGGQEILRHQSIPNDLIAEYFAENLNDEDDDTTEAAA